MPYVLNGTAQMFTEPVEQSGTLYVPLADVAEAVGAIVEWDNLGKVATIDLDGHVVRVRPDTTTVEVNGETTEIQAFPFLADGTLWAPVRLFESHLSCDLNYDGETVTLNRRF